MRLEILRNLGKAVGSGIQHDILRARSQPVDQRLILFDTGIDEYHLRLQARHRDAVGGRLLVLLLPVGGLGSVLGSLAARRLGLGGGGRGRIRGSGLTGRNGWRRGVSLGRGIGLRFAGAMDLGRGIGLVGLRGERRHRSVIDDARLQRHQQGRRRHGGAGAVGAVQAARQPLFDLLHDLLLHAASGCRRKRAWRPRVSKSAIFGALYRDLTT